MRGGHWTCGRADRARVRVAVLDEVVRAAAAGQGGAVLIEGEAGIGKTRLMGLARASAGGRTARPSRDRRRHRDRRRPAAARVRAGRAARDVAPDGPARLGVLALEGALAGSERAVAATRSCTLWWLIVELADERPLALPRRRPVGRRADPRAAAAGGAARDRAAAGARRCRAAALQPGTGTPSSAPSAFARVEPAAASPPATARMVEAMLGRPGSVSPSRGRAQTRGNPLYLREPR